MSGYTITSSVTTERVQDLNHYGFDVEDRLTSMLSEELAKQIDKEIVNELTDPFSKFNDPDGSKKRKRDLRKNRTTKIKRVYGNE